MSHLPYKRIHLPLYSLDSHQSCLIRCIPVFVYRQLSTFSDSESTPNITELSEL